jgi:hypothetical protein
MGVHISKVRSTNLDTWQVNWIESMVAKGNTICNAEYEYHMCVATFPTQSHRAHYSSTLFHVVTPTPPMFHDSVFPMFQLFRCCGVAPAHARTASVSFPRVNLMLWCDAVAPRCFLQAGRGPSIEGRQFTKGGRVHSEEIRDGEVEAARIGPASAIGYPAGCAEEDGGGGG